ncbi:hypothetical protein M426DRAFT_12957 [Hypoxylon sp. CI-4A]|nr:hypothetical protein M426DRAFT_12957 [Hypoxylon sp. CI-4A]
MSMLADAISPSSSEAVGLLAVDEDEKEPVSRTRNLVLGRLSPSFILINVLVISLVVNAIQLGVWLRERAAANRCRSPVAGLRPSKLVSFGEKTEWSDTSNMTALDELWYGWDVNQGVIQLPKDSHFGSTQDFPWDESKGLYMLNSYHGLHCLKIIYSYIRDWEEGRARVQTIDHVAHCLEVIRADIVCEADDTLLPFDIEQRTEMPPKRMCRSWGQLKEFAIQNSACFLRHEPSDPLYDTLTEYMNCPPSSPYYSFVEGLKAMNST